MPFFHRMITMMNKTHSYSSLDVAQGRPGHPRLYPTAGPKPQTTFFRSQFIGLLFLSAICFLLPPPAEARMNLPQVRQLIQLEGGTRASARVYFSRPRSVGELPAPLQDSLLRSLPEDFLNTCGSIVQQWGADNALRKDFWRVRLLHHQDVRAWLAFQCGLTEQDPVPFYDERLALLHLDAATLELLPLGPDTGDDFYHIEFEKRFALKSAQGFSFRVTTINNPCCDGPESRSQERLMVFANTPHGAVESFSVVTARDDLSHCDDPEVDTETKGHSHVKFERDANSFVTTVNVNFRETVIDTHWESGKPEPHTVSDHSGTRRFRWNPTTFKFEEIR